MIDGDEIITIASETGYRLCLCDTNIVPTDQSYFSGSWCPNQQSCYYSCTMDGFIHCRDTTDGSCKQFEVLFRKFSGSYETRIEPGRRISLHWDKMCLIPSRPGDVLFLLGVAKCLFYSAFPGSLSPMAASVHSCSPGFTYGTPVMELLKHSSRITSVEVSPCGHIVATGDENGYVKMIVLNRPEHLKYTVAKHGRQTEEFNFSFEEEALNATGIRCHTGPVFSFAWLDFMAPPEKEKSPEEDEDWSYTDHQEKMRFSLATGSCDRCVRIWQVSWTRRGIVASPVATLDTLSSSLLGLSSSILTQTEHATSGFVKSRHHDRKKQSADKNSLTTIAYKTQLLVGCTDVGTIYVWRLHPSDLLSSPDSVSPSVDSGMHLISMVHSSDYPIIKASLILLDKSNKEKAPISRYHMEDQPDDSILLLAASDTRGTVRMHSSTLIDFYNEKLSPGGSVAAPPSRSPLHTASSSRGQQSLFSPAGRSVQSSVIRDMRSPRSVGPMVRQLAGSSRSRSSIGNEGPIMVLFSLVGEAVYDSPVLMCSFRSVLEPVGQDGVGSISIYTQITNLQTSYLDIFLANGVMKQIRADALLQLPNHRVGLDGVEESGDSEGEEEEEAPRLTIPVPSPRRFISSSSAVTSADSSKGLDVGKQNEEKPRASKDICEQKIDGKTKRTKNTENTPSTEAPASSRGPSSEITPQKVTCWEKDIRTQKGAGGRFTATDQDDFSQSATPADQKKDSDSVKRTTERQNSAQSVRSKNIEGGKARRTVSIAEGNNTAFSPVKDPPDFEMSSAIENEPLSMFSEPSLNSSKNLLEALKNLEYADIEDVSVSTVETTSTDRRMVADSIVNMKFSEERYVYLPDVTEEEIARRMPPKPNLRPQVDRHWKFQKNSLAPTAACISAITPTDSVVQLRLLEDADSDTLQELAVDPESEGEGRCSSFVVNVRMSDVFGKLDASSGSGWQQDSFDSYRDDVASWSSGRYGLV